MKLLVLSFLLLIGNLLPLRASEYLLPNTLNSLPVLIAIPLGNNTFDYGTGCFLATSNKVFLVTAAHVIFDVYSTNRLQLNGSTAVLYYYESTNRYTTTISLQRLLGYGCVKRHPSHDVAVVQMGTALSGDLNRGSCTVAWPKDAVSDGATINPYSVDSMCRNFADVNAGSEMYVFGYPVELFNAKLPSEIDFSYPVIRTGVISQKNMQTGKLILDSGVYGGNSGGPVIVVEHPQAGLETYKLAGLVVKFVPVLTRLEPQIGITNSDFVNSGYGVAEPIDYALELMK